MATEKKDMLDEAAIKQVCAAIERMTVLDLFYLMHSVSIELLDRAQKTEHGNSSNLGQFSTPEFAIVFARGRDDVQSLKNAYREIAIDNVKMTHEELDQ